MHLSKRTPKAFIVPKSPAELRCIIGFIEAAFWTQDSLEAVKGFDSLPEDPNHSYHGHFSLPVGIVLTLEIQEWHVSKTIQSMSYAKFLWI